MLVFILNLFFNLIFLEDLSYTHMVQKSKSLTNVWGEAASHHGSYHLPLPMGHSHYSTSIKCALYMCSLLKDNPKHSVHTALQLAFFTYFLSQLFYLSEFKWKKKTHHHFLYTEGSLHNKNRGLEQGQYIPAGSCCQWGPWVQGLPSLGSRETSKCWREAVTHSAPSWHFFCEIIKRTKKAVEGKCISHLGVQCV